MYMQTAYAVISLYMSDQDLGCSNIMYGSKRNLYTNRFNMVLEVGRDEAVYKRGHHLGPKE